MRKFGWKIVCTAVALALSACGGSSGDDDDVDTNALVQFINAIADTPVLTVTITVTDEDDVETESILGSISYQGATALTSLEQDDYTVTISYVDPETGSDTNLFTDEAIIVTRDVVHSFVLNGPFSNPSIMEIEKPVGNIDNNDEEDENFNEDKFEVQALNLSTGTLLDVHFGSPSSSLGSPLTTLSAAESSIPQELVEGDYRVRITETGSTAVRYDSGTFDTPERTRRLVIVTDNVGPDPLTHDVFVVTQAGTLSFPNDVARAGLRAVNMIAEESETEISIRDSITGTPLLDTTVAFRDITPYQTVDPNFINVSVIVPSDPDNDVNSTVSLNQDAFFTVVVAGTPSEDTVAIRTVTGDMRPVATATNIQFINTLPETDVEDFERVDLYALPIGDSLGDTGPIFSQVDFLGSSSSSLPATAVDLVVTTAGTQSILAGPIRLSLEGGASILVIAAQGVGGGLPNQIVVHITSNN